MTASLWRNHILPFSLLLGLLVAATLAADYLLHRLDLVWVGRYMGIPGILILVVSLVYSLRKRKHIKSGNLKSLLTFHEAASWFGSWLVLIHAGVHFNTFLPWMATTAMGVNVVSGMVGKRLLERSRQHVQGRRTALLQRGMPVQEVERELFIDALTLDAMTKWRKVHIPISIVFAALAAGHVLSILLFWGWR